MTDFLALITIMIWPGVPLFWIPVHGLSRIFKKLGLLTYVMPLITWIPLCYFIYINRGYLLSIKIDFPFLINLSGIIFFICGTLLQLWTGQLLGIRGLVGLPEISAKAKSRLIVKGPFSVVRHPTYLAHTMMLLGVFLITGSAAVGIVTLLDILIINLAVIPLEDRELLERFGKAYAEHKKRVPAFFPRLFKGKEI